jgi:hypothetical protein
MLQFNSKQKQLKQHKNYFNLRAMPQASLGFIEQTTFHSQARNAACNLLNPLHYSPPEVMYSIFFLY